MVGPAPVTDNAAVAPVPSLPGIPQLPETTSVIKPSSTPADYYTPPTSTAPVAGKPATSSLTTADAVPTSKCNCKIVTATTFITITSTKSYAAPTAAPELDDSEDGQDGDDSDDGDSDDADADAAQPTYAHGGHVHGSRLRRS